MNLLEKILFLPIARMVVPHSTLPGYREVLKADLEQRGVEKKISLSSELLDRLLHEAFVRAQQKEDDGLARVWHMYRQVEEVAEQVSLSCSGAIDSDPIISRILSHHSREEPNQPPQTTTGSGAPGRV